MNVDRLFLSIGAECGLRPDPDAGLGRSGVSENYDRFGFAFAAGDFDGDGNDDLAIGVPEENLETVPANDAGIVQVLNGT